MFTGIKHRKSFSYATAKSLKRDEKTPLKKRMQFSSLSSQEIKRSKKRLIFFLVLLAVVTAFILYHGLRSSGIRELRIEEKNIERINGE